MIALLLTMCLQMGILILFTNWNKTTLFGGVQVIIILRKMKNCIVQQLFEYLYTNTPYGNQRWVLVGIVGADQLLLY